MRNPRLIRAIAGSLLLLTVFACGGGEGSGACDTWTAAPPASINVGPNSDEVFSFVASYPVTSATLSAGSSSVPTGLTITSLGGSAFRINTTAATPLGTYNLKITGATTADGVCSQAEEEDFVVNVANPM
ncbi:MAG TPA: hypothetical protein VK171_05560 [Fimbriimonas sp.]|nr:hypothetical protein [Fimbriimonas sp.]